MLYWGLLLEDVHVHLAGGERVTGGSLKSHRHFSFGTKLLSDGDAKCGTGNTVRHVVLTVWCQVGAGHIGGPLCEVHD